MSRPDIPLYVINQLKDAMLGASLNDKSFEMLAPVPTKDGKGWDCLIEGHGKVVHVVVTHCANVDVA